MKVGYTKTCGKVKTVKKYVLKDISSQILVFFKYDVL